MSTSQMSVVGVQGAVSGVARTPRCPRLRAARRITAACAVCLLLAAETSLGAQISPPPTGSIHGKITTDPGTVPLSGVTVTVVSDARGVGAASTVTDADGEFSFAALAPGRYRMSAALEGFSAVARAGITVAAGRDTNVALEMPLVVASRIEAVSAPIEIPATGSSEQAIAGREIDVLPVRGDDYQALLPMLPGVIRGTDGRVNVNGGRPAETGLQINDTSAADPTTGDAALDLPIDAIASIDVQPNPYAAEYGRFSAGVVRLDTEKGGDVWKVTANNFIPVPCLKVCDGTTVGVRSYDPRLLVSGPIISGRLSVAESLQAHDHEDPVSSLPSGQRETWLRGFDSFTRLDATLGRHALTGSVGVSTTSRQFAGLNTFNPQPVTPDVSHGGYHATLTDTLQVSDTVRLVSTMSRARADVSVTPQDSGVMTFTPDGNEGRYFNQQAHQAWTTEWLEALEIVANGAGQHLVNVGVDVSHASFDGTSESSPVEIRREDGTLSQQMDFSGASSQHLAATSLGTFIQDRWRMNDRLLVEIGGRLDRDGVTREISGSPRLGYVLSVRPRGQSVVRGGIGLFAGRTPLMAGAFSSLDAPTVTTFMADGVTPVGPPIAFVNRLDGPLRTPTSRTWNVEYDHQLSSRLIAKLNHLERRGWNELVVDEATAGASGTIDLASDGRSSYVETEATLRYADTRQREIIVSYVRSESRADLNAFDAYFGAIRNPIIRPDEYGVTSTDVPNRLIVRARLPIGRWTIAPVVEARSGFPYSPVDENQEFVGPRDSRRFPLFYTFDLNVTRLVTFHGRTLRVGLRTNNVLNRATPQDVQNNVDSPAFGTFYNPLVRQVSFMVEIQR